jgi:hypothetical protein
MNVPRAHPWRLVRTSGVASENKNRPGAGPSISMTLVTVMSPIDQVRMAASVARWWTVPATGRHTGAVNRLRRMRHAALFALPMLLVTQCAPQCAPGPSAPAAPTPPAPPPAPAATVQGIPVPTLGAGTTPYRLPVADPGLAGWATTHHDYPATDIFVHCGEVLVSPVNGVVVESRFDDHYVASVDDPALRGGRTVTIVGDDGVRYYLAHFQSVDTDIVPGARVAIGQRLGLMGQSGDASACHVHFGISMPCPGKEWSVRRGVVWPYPYLADWKAGGQRSPVAEVQQWAANHPDACAQAEADPHAPEA